MTVSMLHMAIARSMRELGLPVQLEYNEGYFSVDLAMFLPPSVPGGQPRKVRSRKACVAAGKDVMQGAEPDPGTSRQYCRRQEGA